MNPITCRSPVPVSCRGTQCPALLGAAPATVDNAVVGTSILGSIIFSTIGAVILLLILRLFNRS